MRIAKRKQWKVINDDNVIGSGNVIDSQDAIMWAGLLMDMPNYNGKPVRIIDPQGREHRLSGDRLSLVPVNE